MNYNKLNYSKFGINIFALVLLLHAFVFVIEAKIRTATLGTVNYLYQLVLIKGKRADVVIIFLVIIKVEAVLAAPYL